MSAIDVRWSGGFSTALDVELYPNNEHLVRCNRDYQAQRVLVKDPTFIYTALHFIDACKFRGFPTPELILPYLPGQRQDRLNDRGDFLFTAKSIARDINARGVEVITVDPHSAVMPALLDKVRIVTSAEIINRNRKVNKLWDKIDAVIAPDAGAEKRASAVAEVLEVPLIHSWKVRNIEDGKLIGTWLEEFWDREAGSDYKNLLVVDDICDGGSTFVLLAEAIERMTYDRESPSKLQLHLYVTHGLFTKGTRELFKHYKSITTTDSVPHKILPGEKLPNLINVLNRLMDGLL